MRIVLFTGKGGVGKTTTAAATALRLADRNIRTLLMSTDAAHSLGDVLARRLTGRPTPVADRLWAVQLDAQERFESAWRQVQSYLLELLAQNSVDAVTAEELAVLPGIEEVLSLLAVQEFADAGDWDALVIDCAPTAETLRLLALPEALSWYLQRVFPTQRRMARGMRPLAALLGNSTAVPADAVFTTVAGLADRLAQVQRLLLDPQCSSVRLVLTPEATVCAETRRTFTALALYGYRVDGVIANRVFPAGHDPWRQRWAQAQQRHLSEIRHSFAGLPIQELEYRQSEPIGTAELRQIADALYGPLPGQHPAAPLGDAPAGPLLHIERCADGYLLRLPLPLAGRGTVDAARVGQDLIVTVGTHRRVLSLPTALRRCEVAGGQFDGQELRIRFRDRSDSPDSRPSSPAEHTRTPTGGMDG